VVPSLLQSNLPHRPRSRFLLFPLWVALLAVLASCAATAIPSVARTGRGIFRIAQEVEDGFTVATAWIVPGESSRVITAKHAVDGKGPILLKVGEAAVPMMVVKIGEGDMDVALLIPVIDGSMPVLEEFSPLTWCKAQPEIGDVLWVVGFPALMKKLLPVPATILSTDPAIFTEKQDYLAITSPALLPGHSGAPVLGPDNCVAGMAVMSVVDDGAKDAPGSLEVAIPAQAIRKFIKQ
jgi:S1-C subfamily serine protease